MPTSITLYDSYQKKEIVLDPANTVVGDTLKLYSCGPTVYNYMHIGNLRAAWLGDVISRVGRLAGWDTQWISNITDVGHLVDDGDNGEDKLEKGAKREGKNVQDIINFYTDDYVKQCQAIGIDLPMGVMRPKATEYIEEQMILSLELLMARKAYLLEDGIYFDSEYNNEIFDSKDFVITDPLRTILETQAKQKAGQSNQFNDRDIKNTTKNPGDFALWKFVSEDSLQKWRMVDIYRVQEKLHFWVDNNWYLEDIREDYLDLSIRIDESKGLEEYYVNDGDGKDSLDRLQDNLYNLIGNSWGCPGWHSECVAMVCQVASNFHHQVNSTSFSFDPFKNTTVIDLHLGGEDHIDVHHKNEILQSEALGFHLSKYWVHNKFVLVDGKKMSKSLGNVFLVAGKYEDTGFYSLSNPPREVQDKYKIKRFDPLAYRLMLMEHHYTTQLDFTWDKLAQSQARLFNLRKLGAKIMSVAQYINIGSCDLDERKVKMDKYRNELIMPLIDNLDFSKFLDGITAEMTKLVEELSSAKITSNSKIITTGVDRIKSIEDLEIESLNEEAFILDLNVLSLELDEKLLALNLFDGISAYDAEFLADKRQLSKHLKNWSEADRLRREIATFGWQVDDYPWGYGLWWNPTLLP